MDFALGLTSTFILILVFWQNISCANGSTMTHSFGSICVIDQWSCEVGPHLICLMISISLLAVSRFCMEQHKAFSATP